MSEQRTIDHEGIIESIRGATAKVIINSQSACASCHARGACSAADKEAKVLDVPVGDADIHPGDRVRVLITRRMGLRAVAFGYIYPFLLVLMILVLLTASGIGELRAGSIALASLLPYYLGLFLLRHRIGKAFTFSLEKLNISI